MQNERQNNHTQHTVGELQQLPDGFVFNSQKVWSGLEQQLPVKEKKNTSWYYAAAAILLVTGTVYLSLLKNDTTLPVSEQPTADLSLPSESIQILLPDHQKNKRHTKVPAHASKKHNFQSTDTKAQELQKINSVVIETVSQVIAPAEQTAAIIPPMEQAKEEKKKSPAIAVTKTVSKKYKVIHLNELMQSFVTPDPQSILSRSEFKKMIQQQNEEKEISLPAENNAKQLFFFKLKSANTTNTISIVEN